MWKPGEVVGWRGVRAARVWHVQPTLVVRDEPAELALTLLPGTECLAEASYPLGKQHAKRWWDFPAADWELAPYIWRTNRLLLLFEPEKFYSTILFWNEVSGDFLCYYINFQVPFQRRPGYVDTLDLELDLLVHPDFRLEWKDVEDYQRAIEEGLISAVWRRAIEAASPEILERIQRRRYPFDGSWLDWQPDPAWAPPRLPAGWDQL